MQDAHCIRAKVAIEAFCVFHIFFALFHATYRLLLTYRRKLLHIYGSVVYVPTFSYQTFQTVFGTMLVQILGAILLFVVVFLVLRSIYYTLRYGPPSGLVMVPGAWPVMGHLVPVCASVVYSMLVMKK